MSTKQATVYEFRGQDGWGLNPAFFRPGCVAGVVLLGKKFPWKEPAILGKRINEIRGRVI